MVKFGKWLGGGIGWAFGGPIGALVGFALGALFDNASISVEKADPAGSKFRGNTGTQAGDFAMSLLVLSAAVMKVDGKTMKSELDYVKGFLVNQFGEYQAKQLLQVLSEVIKKDIPVYDVCIQIRQNMPLSARLQLLHYLYGISKADGDVHEKEVQLIDSIADYLNISGADATSIKAMYYRDVESDYKILEISSSASDEELKKAYRKMAMKYHPDKVTGMGEAVQKSAGEKFKSLQEAYERIKKKRNLN
ncbi:MAG TPA: TerB family tellurite resistance protein [Bacteroidia bacterium]